MDLNTAIKRRIRSLMKERGMSQLGLSSESDIPVSTLSSILSDDGNPTAFNIEKICDGFGMSVKEFFDDESFAMIGGKQNNKEC